MIAARKYSIKQEVLVVEDDTCHTGLIGVIEEYFTSGNNFGYIIQFPKEIFTYMYWEDELEAV